MGWWLFADTYARYAPVVDDGSIIRFAHFGSYQDYELWRNVIEDFTRLHPDVQVRQEYVVGLAGQYDAKMRQQILSDALPDVALVQPAPFHELADHFVDLSDLIVEDNPDGGFDASGLSSFQYRGRQKALPVSGGSLLIYGNKTCFERAAEFHGHPIPLPDDDWTMADFRRTAGLLTCDFDGDGRLDQFGFRLPRWVYYLPFLWSFGAELTNDAMQTWTLTGTEAEQAMTFYRDLAVGDRVCPRDDEVPQLFQDTGFLAGKTAMCVNGPWLMPFLAKTKLADGYFVAPIPYGPAARATRITWDGAALAKGRGPKRREVARRFVRFLLSPAVQERIARTGRALPSRKESLSHFLVGDAHPASRQRFIDALVYSHPQPPFPRFGEMDRVVNRHLYRWLDPADQRSAAEMLDQLAHDPVIESIFPGVKAVAP